MVSRARARVLRSAAVGTAGAGLAVTAHAVAGGGTPAPATVAAASAGLAALAWAAAHGPLGTARLIGLLGGAQAALHALFTIAEPAASHAHHGAAAAGSPPSSAAEGGMVAAHLAATLALALLLRRGEAWLFRVSRAVCRLARRLCGHALPPAHDAGAARAHRAPYVALPARRPLAGAASRRGPPVAASPLA